MLPLNMDSFTMLLWSVKLLLKSKERFLDLLQPAALAIHYDALGDNQDNTMGLENRANVGYFCQKSKFTYCTIKESRRKRTGSTKAKPKIEFYDKDRKQGAAELITTAKV
ncbi:hypothetical protein V2J09_021597 [Rumex salicifolius]